MSATLLVPEPSALSPLVLTRGRRLPASLPRDSWLVPLAVALGLHLVLLAFGFLNRHDTLLDLIAKGSVEAVAPVAPPTIEQEVTLEETPAPPPEPAPDFVKPEEVRPKVVEAPKPPPKAEAVPQPEAKPVPQVAFAASGVVIGDKNFPKPPYPFNAKLRHFQGTVVVALTIVGGQVTNAEVADSSGYAILDTTAVQWIRQRWHFPSEVTRNLTQPIKFQLANS